METFAVAEVCAARQVAFSSIRVVNDTADEALPHNVEHLLAQKTAAARLGAALGAVLHRPASAKDMYQLRENALSRLRPAGQISGGDSSPLLPVTSGVVATPFATRPSNSVQLRFARPEAGRGQVPLAGHDGCRRGRYADEFRGLVRRRYVRRVRDGGSGLSGNGWCCWIDLCCVDSQGILCVRPRNADLGNPKNGGGNNGIIEGRKRNSPSRQGNSKPIDHKPS